MEIQGVKGLIQKWYFIKYICKITKNTNLKIIFNIKRWHVLQLNLLDFFVVAFKIIRNHTGWNKWRAVVTARFKKPDWYYHGSEKVNIFVF